MVFIVSQAFLFSGAVQVAIASCFFCSVFRNLSGTTHGLGPKKLGSIWPYQCEKNFGTPSPAFFLWLYMTPLPLPPDAVRLCEALAAPALLIRHLALVHAAAVELLDGLTASFPGLVLDRDAILFGAATHDIGKVLHPEELFGPGNQHEEDGPGLLEQHGVPPRLAHFARSHGRWHEVEDLEDLLVALADNIWRGRRVEELEAKVAAVLAIAVDVDQWMAWSKLDAICEKIASRGEQRLAIQAGLSFDLRPISS